MRYGEQGRLAIGFGAPLMGGNLHATVSEYLLRYPDVQFDASEEEPTSLLNALQHHMLDAAIVATDIKDAGIRHAPLWSERIKVVLPDDHVLASCDPIHWSDLKHDAVVLPRRELGSSLSQQLRVKMTGHGLRTNIIVQGTSHETVLNMVRLGRFITVATESMQGVPWPGVVFKDVEDANGHAHLDFSIYWHEDNRNPTLRQFFRLIGERFSIAQPMGEP